MPTNFQIPGFEVEDQYPPQNHKDQLASQYAGYLSHVDEPTQKDTVDPRQSFDNWDTLDTRTQQKILDQYPVPRPDVGPQPEKFDLEAWRNSPPISIDFSFRPEGKLGDPGYGKKAATKVRSQDEIDWMRADYEHGISRATTPEEAEPLRKDYKEFMDSLTPSKDTPMTEMRSDDTVATKLTTFMNNLGIPLEQAKKLVAALDLTTGAVSGTQRQMDGTGIIDYQTALEAALTLIPGGKAAGTAAEAAAKPALKAVQGGKAIVEDMAKAVDQEMGAISSAIKDILSGKSEAGKKALADLKGSDKTSRQVVKEYTEATGKQMDEYEFAVQLRREQAAEAFLEVQKAHEAALEAAKKYNGLRVIEGEKK